MLCSSDGTSDYTTCTAAYQKQIDTFYTGSSVHICSPAFVCSKHLHCCHFCLACPPFSLLPVDRARGHWDLRPLFHPCSVEVSYPARRCSRVGPVPQYVMRLLRARDAEDRSGRRSVRAFAWVSELSFSRS